MKLSRTIFGVAAGVALLAAGAAQTAWAQHIADQFTISTQNVLYQPQAGKGIIIPRNAFLDVYSNVVNPDDGVAGPIPIGFPFEFDNQLFTDVYISVNGWLNFEGRFITSDPYTLFSANNGPNLTVAPYFGDHYLRTPGYDLTDPLGRTYTPSYIRYIQEDGGFDAQGNPLQDRFVVEWENLNINYYFDPVYPDDPFSPNRQPQAPSIASFQAHLVEAPFNEPSRSGDIEFHYGPAGTSSGTSIVKISGASVGLESAPYVPNGTTTWMNAVAWLESGFDNDSLRKSTRLTANWPPSGLPGRIFLFSSRHVRRIGSWGDGDANLTQLDVLLPGSIRGDQRRFVTFADVIRILRHSATRNLASTQTSTVDFDSVFGRHGFHGDVNHNGRFYYSSSKYNNSGDSLDQFGQIVYYKVLFPTKDVNPALPFPQDNTFNGFLFDADEFDASLIMTYLAAKLPVLPWLPDTLPPFTGKVTPNVANNVDLRIGGTVTGNTVEIPVRFNGVVNGAQSIAFDAAPGTKIVDIRFNDRTDNKWITGYATESRAAIAVTGHFEQGDVVATLVVEANPQGDVVFRNVRFSEKDKGLYRLSPNSAVETGAATLGLSQNMPNPFSANAKTSISYTTPVDGSVMLRVFDVLGRQVRTLINSDVKAGTYTTEWDGLNGEGKQVESGIYYYQIQAGGKSVTRSMQVQK
ncbi:MAG: T9SS type A sorting domain-containing protein [Armatimonadetes bacterium]|nr:T9SS type A sorting domain-containing protein [Armatimonadota bacterium]